MNFDYEAIASKVIDTAYRIHTKLGPGLLESVYRDILAELLRRDGFTVEQEVPVSVKFEGIEIKNDLRLDLLVNSHFIVELKSVEMLRTVHYKQLLTYLRVLNEPLGLLVNFGGETLKGNCKRVVNGYEKTEA